MEPKILALFIAFIVMACIVELIRQQKMTFKYSIAWFVAVIAAAFFALQDGILTQMARLSGFEVTSNFIFFLFCAFFGILILFLTVYINEQNSRTETLAQSLGIMRYKLEQLEQKIKKNSSS